MNKIWGRKTSLMIATVFFLSFVFAAVPGRRAAASEGYISEEKDDEDYTPAADAVSGGYWETLQSGEQVYCSEDGTPYVGTWVFDKDAYYYIDHTGCLMRGNYSEEGFWVLDSGIWDQTQTRRRDVVEPLESRSYGTDPSWIFRTENSYGIQNVYASKSYSFGSEETYLMSPIGRSIYTLTDTDGMVAAQMSVTPDTTAILISQGGYTQRYEIQGEISEENAAPAETTAEPAPAETTAEPALTETTAEPAPAETTAEPASPETTPEAASSEPAAELTPSNDMPANDSKMDENTFFDDILQSYNGRQEYIEQCGDPDIDMMTQNEDVNFSSELVSTEKWFVDKYKNAVFDDLNIQYLCRKYVQGLEEQMRSCAQYLSFNMESSDYDQFDEAWTSGYISRCYVITELADYFDVPFEADGVATMQEQVDELESSNEAATINSGVSHETVKEAQTLLHKIGFRCWNIDGIAGEKTVRAIKRFQEMYGYEPIDGIIDEELIDQLRTVAEEKGVLEEATGAVSERETDQSVLINAGDIEAAAEMASNLIYGNGVEVDLEKGFELALKAAEAGNDRGMFLTARCYHHGKGVEQDYVKAMEWYQKAAEHGHSTAVQNIGYMYQYGQGVERDYNKAMEWYLKAADLGESSAMHNIGFLYSQGYGVEQDYNKAMEWYQKAADLGEIAAIFNIGYMYYEGLGVEQDYNKAMEWYLKAADLGDPIAMNNVGYMYAEGNGVEQDYNKAMVWYQKAADLGQETTMYEIGVMYSKGQGVEQDYKKAMEWYLKSAALGNTSAMYSIGFAYENGLGVERDMEKATEWYQKSIDAGYEPDEEEQAHLTNILGNNYVPAETG